MPLGTLNVLGVPLGTSGSGTKAPLAGFARPACRTDGVDPTTIGGSRLSTPLGVGAGASAGTTRKARRPDTLIA